MFSKFLPWDLVKARPEFVTSGKSGLFCFLSPDPYLEKIFLRKVNIDTTISPFKVVIGNELTISFIEENFINVGLFGDSSPYLVLLSENISKDALSFLVDHTSYFSDRLIVLAFSTSNKNWDELKKQDAIETLQIEAPRFWESKKLLQFLCDEMGIELDYEITNRFVDEVNFDTGDYLQVLKNLALEAGSRKIHNAKILAQAVSSHRLDHFELATLFGSKQRHKFIDILERNHPDYSDLISFLSFLERHLGKLLDPSHLEKKSRLSKYDQEIKAHSSLWEPEELVREMKFIGQLIMDAKSKKVLVHNQMREHWLAIK